MSLQCKCRINHQLKYLTNACWPLLRTETIAKQGVDQVHRSSISNQLNFPPFPAITPRMINILRTANWRRPRI